MATARARNRISQIKDWRFARRVLTNGDIGFAEGLMAGEWESADLAALLTLLADNVERFTRLLEGGSLGKALNWLRHLTNANTRARLAPQHPGALRSGQSLLRGLARSAR